MCCDNGPGVPHELADDIFRPFVSGGRAGGAGLGLAIARDLVCAHGGDITIAETGKQGTTFRFTLPLLMRVMSGRPITAPWDLMRAFKCAC